MIRVRSVMYIIQYWLFHFLPLPKWDLRSCGWSCVYSRAITECQIQSDYFNIKRNDANEKNSWDKFCWVHNWSWKNHSWIRARAGIEKAVMQIIFTVFVVVLRSAESVTLQWMLPKNCIMPYMPCRVRRSNVWNGRNGSAQLIISFEMISMEFPIRSQRTVMQ